MSDFENIDDGKVYDSVDKHQMDDEANMNYADAFNQYPSTNAGDIESEVDDNASDLEPEDEDVDEDFGTDAGGGDDVEGGGSDDASGGADSV